MIKKFATISKFLLIFMLMTAWIYSGGVVVTEIYDKEDKDEEIVTIMWE